jgi:DNA-binding winged helix-turn-helix (wHTH) protein
VGNVDRRVYRFGEFVVEPSTAQLWRNGQRLEIDPEALRLLAYLVENPETDLASADLRLRLWPAANFLDGERSLTTAADRLRETLNDSRANPRYLARLEGGGYRFVHPVRAGMNEPDLALLSRGATMQSAPLLTAPKFAPRVKKVIFIALAIQLLVMLAMFVFVWRRFNP